MSETETTKATRRPAEPATDADEIRAEDLTWEGFDPEYQERLTEKLENARVATVCPDVRNHALGSLVEVSAITGLEMFFRSGCVGWHRENHTMRLSLVPTTDDAVVAHEFAHTVHMSHGWDIGPEGRENVAYVEDDFYAYDAYPEAYYLTTGRPLASGVRHDSAVDDLVREVNIAFRRLYRANRDRNRDEAKLLDFGHPYAGYNAAETFAELHERMQTDDNLIALRAIMCVRRHDEFGGGLLTAYLRVFNPSPTVARLLTAEEIAAAM